MLFVFTACNQSYKTLSLILDDCGDHVVLMNTAYIALPGEEWTRRVYFHHTQHAGGATWTLAHELHEKNKTKVSNRSSVWASKAFS